MALGDIVKVVLVKLRTDGAAAAKEQMAAVAEQARALGRMDPTINVKVDKDAALRLRAMRLQLDALKLAGDTAGLQNLANELRALGTASDDPRIRLRALRLQMEALRGTIGKDDGGGLLGSLLMLIGRGGGSLGAGGIAGGGLTGAVGLGGVAFAALGIIPALVAAGAGLAAFGALAIPTFTTVTGAVSRLSKDTAAYQNATTAAAKSTALAKIKADWAALDPAQRQAVRGIQHFQAAWADMAKKLEPLVMKVFNEGLKIAEKLLPLLLPFAQAAGQAILGLLQGLDKFTSSQGFKDFTAQLLKLSGPAITAIGEGMGRLAVAAGKLLLAMANPAAIRVMTVLFEAVAGLIAGLAAFFAWATPRFNNSVREVTNWGRTLRRWFDDVRHAFAVAGHTIAHTFDDLRHDIARWADDARATFDRVRHDIARWTHDGMQMFDDFRHRTAVIFDGIRHDIAHYWDMIWNNTIGRIERGIGDAVRWFKGLPRKIMSAISDLPGKLFQAGVNAMKHLISGLGSMLGALGNMATSIVSKIAGFFGLSPALEGPLSGSGSMFIRGQHIPRDLAAGMASGAGYVGAAAGLMARAAIPGGAMTGGAMTGAGGIQVVMGAAPGADQAVMRALWPYLRAEVRVRGGGGPQSVQRALGVVWR